MSCHGGMFYDSAIKYDFSEGINPLGMPAGVKEILGEYHEEYAFYPDEEALILRNALAKYLETDVSNILCGNGAEELIWKICQVFRPENVLIISPTFSEYKKAALENGAEVFEYVLNEENDFILDDLFLLSDMFEKADMIFICNPNNPTGKLVKRELLENIIEKAFMDNKKVVVDECYIEFTEALSILDLCEKFNNLFVIRAFTKIFAMAGIRLGYVVSDAENVSALKEYGPCWNVSSVAQLSGEKALIDTVFIDKTRAYIKKEKDFIIGNLCHKNTKVYDSDSDFILIKSIPDIFEKLREKGIGVRDASTFNGLSEGYIRVGIKSHEMNQIFIDSYREIVERI